MLLVRQQLLQVTAKSNGPIMGHQASQLALPAHGSSSREHKQCCLSPWAQMWESPDQGSVVWEQRCGLLTKCCDLKLGSICTVYLHRRQSLPLPPLHWYGHTFVLYLKSLDAVKKSCQSVQRWSIIAEVLFAKKNPPIIITDKMRLLFKHYFPICVWQILAV